MMTTFTSEAVNAQIRDIVIDVIDGVRGATCQRRLQTAARLLGLSFDRIRCYRYGRVRKIEAHEAFQIIKRAQEIERQKFARMELEYEAQRLAIANSAPSYLAWLVPPAVGPLLDPEDRSDVEGDRSDVEWKL